MTPLFTANGQIPPIVWPIKFSVSSGFNIFALTPNSALNLALSIRVSPAHTIKTGLLPVEKERVLAILQGSHCRASAASATVALEVLNSFILLSIPAALKNARTFSIDIILCMVPFLKKIPRRDNFSGAMKSSGIYLFC